MKSRLKPCPNCKSYDCRIIYHTHHVRAMILTLSYTDYGVRCDNCGLEINGYLQEASAVVAWNRRTADERTKS